MYIFAEPVTEEQVQALQSRNDAKIEEFERDILGLNRPSSESDEVEKEDDNWADIQANVQEAMDKDERSLDTDNIQAEQNASTDDEAETHAISQGDTAFGESGDNLSPLVSEDADVEQDEENEEEDEEGNGQAETAATKLEGEETIMDDGEEEIEEEGEEEQNKLRNNVKENEAERNQETFVKDDNEQETIIEATTNSKEGLYEQVKVGEVLLDRPVMDPNSQVEAVHENTDEEAHSRGPENVDNDGVLPTNGLSQPSIESRREFETHADSRFLNLIDREKESVKLLEVPNILAMTLTVRNKVNKSYVLRPENLKPADDWSIEYSLAEVPQQDRAWSLYNACQLRRKRKLEDEPQEDENASTDFYVERLRALSRKGKAWRKQKDREDERSPKIVLGQSSPRENLDSDSN